MADNKLSSILEGDDGGVIVHHHERDSKVIGEDTEADWDNWNPMAEDYVSSRNTLALDPDKDPLSSITGKVRPISSKIGNVTICEHFAKYGECVDGEYCDRLHVDPRVRNKIWTLQNTFESNKDRTIMTYTYLSPIEIQPDPQKLLLASVTNATSPANFYVVLPYETMNFSQCTQEDLTALIGRVTRTSSAKTKLQKCHEQLAAIFDTKWRVDNINDDIYPSQVVACKLKDGFYRRAMVIDLPKGSEEFYYKLFLLDLGTEVELPRDLIFDIKAFCLDEPPMAVNCRLDIKPANGEIDWSKEALNLFTEKTRGNGVFLYLTVLDNMSSEGIITVDLYSTKTKRSLTELMLSEKHAERCSF